MKRKKFLYRVTAAMGIALCSLSLLFVAPQTSVTAQAAGGGGTTVSPQSDYIVWIYIEADGKVYKRLWNASKEEWIGDWIYVRDLP